MSMTAIVDYGVGNLFSLTCSVRALGAEAIITGKAEEIRRADRIILPGVGAFGDAITKLKDTGLVPVLEEQIASGKPLMGICLGMQLLFEKSFEYGEHAGLGWLHGSVRSLADALKRTGCEKLKVPHMGWNSLVYTDKKSPLLNTVPEGSFVYFVHSFYATDCDDSLCAWSDYGVRIPAVVGKDNVYGCQFHPEKSGSVGLGILDSFLKL